MIIRHENVNCIGLDDLRFINYTMIILFQLRTLRFSFWEFFINKMYI